MTESVLLQAFNITIIGMLVVFVFLLLLVVAMYVLGALVELMEVYYPQTVPNVQVQGSEDDSLIAVAIAAAKKFIGK